MVLSEMLRTGATMSWCLHEELSQEVGHAQHHQQAVEEGRGPPQRPLPLERDHVHQSRQDKDQGQAARRTRVPAA